MFYCDSLSILFVTTEPPGHPRIYYSSLNITEGHTQRVTCTSTGGHPVATLTWFRGGKKVKYNNSALYNEIQSTAIGWRRIFLAKLTK